MLQMPTTTILTLIVSTFLLALWLGCVLMTTFDVLQGWRSWLTYGNLISIVGFGYFCL
jgi:hypothetical protein